ncbi:conserved hypothetical protein [Pediculus humanus corporis]|uniref:Ig-like domain-containing protein n=1 Tax=Pediculus humanus subsp. corporis TaxID=121224 RepID=E0VBP4_PEDHC|nr:uncharacterized protein Phum_PHUM065940 [Pediculus humanus corporis]EEB10800.1 conserved hypothetical protein [Pediculus humanus corporis]
MTSFPFDKCLLLPEQVSWIRTKDLHILTSGPVTFTSDDRFTCNHDLESSDWSLKLKNSKIDDSGIYECQVNTDPKINRKIILNVGKSLTKIFGKEEQYVKVNSTITFTCLVIAPEETLTSIEWLKNGRQISFQASRGGIIVDTERNERKATSRLTLADVKMNDSGNYTCKPGNAKSHSVSLIVVDGLFRRNLDFDDMKMGFENAGH